MAMFDFNSMDSLCKENWIFIVGHLCSIDLGYYSVVVGNRDKESFGMNIAVERSHILF